MKILITGASGYIGKQLVPYLLSKNYEISVLVKSKTRICNEFWINNVLVYEGDITEPAQLRKCCQEQNVIIHLAAISKTSNVEKNLYQKINVEGTKNIFKACVKANVKKFIYISSTKANEKELLEYAFSKFKAEQYLLQATQECETRVCCLRPGIVYGSNMEGSLISWIRSITKSKAPPIPPVDSTLSMISVEDFCQAIYLCLQKEKVWGNIYEVNDGNPYNVKEIESNIKVSMGKKPGGLYFPLLCFKLISVLGEVLKNYAGINIGFSKNSYNALFKNKYNSNKLFCEHTGFIPTLNFYEKLPQIISSLKFRKNNE